MKFLKRRVEEKTSINSVASRIDISNRHLEWINRNLVALRQELTYILPQSAYFAEKRTEEDLFSINSARGFTGE